MKPEINEEDDDEVDEGRDDKEKDEVKEEDEVNEEDKDDIDENDVSSGIGKSDNATIRRVAILQTSATVKPKHESVDDDLDLDSILEALKEGPDEEEEAEVNEEVSNLRKDLDEARETIKFMLLS